MSRFSFRRRRARARRAFTLIEILVVIVVIAILATLVAPNVFQHVGAAKPTSRAGSGPTAPCPPSPIMPST
jgi:prepilin-type N-terminal cleavage/methylation domain-containing protein